MSSMGTSSMDASKLSRPEKCCLLQHSESIGWLKRQKRYARRYGRSSALIQPNPKKSSPYARRGTKLYGGASNRPSI
jgi:hypothetical protein